MTLKTDNTLSLANCFSIHIIRRATKQAVLLQVIQHLNIKTVNTETDDFTLTQIHKR